MKREDDIFDLVNDAIEANVTTPVAHPDAVIINVTVNRSATGFIKIIINGDEYVEEVLDEEDEEAFVMGGATMYRLFLPYADKLYLTRIVSSFTADVFFPAIKEEEWSLVENEFVPKDEKNMYDLYFQTLIRK